MKRLLRFLFDRFQSDILFNLLLHTKATRSAASIVYFHHKGVFDPALEQADSRRTSPKAASDTLKRG